MSVCLFDRDVTTQAIEGKIVLALVENLYFHMMHRLTIFKTQHYLKLTDEQVLAAANGGAAKKWQTGKPLTEVSVVFVLCLRWLDAELFLGPRNAALQWLGVSVGLLTFFWFFVIVQTWEKSPRWPWWTLIPARSVPGGANKEHYAAQRRRFSPSYHWHGECEVIPAKPKYIRSCFR